MNLIARKEKKPNFLSNPKQNTKNQPSTKKFNLFLTLIFEGHIFIFAKNACDQWKGRKKAIKTLLNEIFIIVRTKIVNRHPLPLSKHLSKFQNISFETTIQ